MRYIGKQTKEFTLVLFKKLDLINIILSEYTDEQKIEYFERLIPLVYKNWIDKVLCEATPELISGIVADYFDMPVEVMLAKTRKREIVQARQIAMYFTKNLTKLSLSQIGLRIGEKDHATVLHAIKTVNNLNDTNKKFKIYISEISERLDKYKIEDIHLKD